MTQPNQYEDTSVDLVSYAKWLIEDQCKGLLHMTDDEISNILGISRPTLGVRRATPENFTVSELSKIIHHLEAVKAMILTTEAS